MWERIGNAPLFKDIAPEQLEACLQFCKGEVVRYEKEEILFHQEEVPCWLTLLLSGTVAIRHDTPSGKRVMVASFDRPGELFGEVFLFLPGKTYEHYAQALTPVEVLRIPKAFFSDHQGSDPGGFRSRMMSNMLHILAGKAYLLNRKLQILSSGSLRRKLSRFLLDEAAGATEVQIAMTREALADYLHIARPSLSRELMQMQEEGLLSTGPRGRFYLNREALEELEYEE